MLANNKFDLLLKTIMFLVVLPTSSMANDKSLFTNSLGMKFVGIAPGTYIMGSPIDEKGRFDNEKQHKVTLTKGFFLQTTEVTVGQWRTFFEDTKYEGGHCAYIWANSKWERKGGWWDDPGFSQSETHPVTCVTRDDIKEFIEWLNIKDGGGYRLPTEAEWEYACRAGSSTAFANGDIQEIDGGHDPNLDMMGWYSGNANEKTHPVAQKKANAWGLYDMHGNVGEWCSDDYNNYPSGRVTDPIGVSKRSGNYIFRGGGWCYPSKLCRSAFRLYGGSGESCSAIGFRLVRSSSQ